MATFFGEVLPVSSRAVDDDDEEEGDQAQPWIPSPELQWCEGIAEEIAASANKCVACSHLIVAVGPAASGFIEAYVLQNEVEKIGSIATGTIEGQGSTSRQRAHSNRESNIYRLTKHPDVLVCQGKQDVLAEQVFQWTQKIFSQIDKSSVEVLILDSSPVQTYKASVSISEIQTPFLRYLRTSKRKINHTIQFLESPNSVKGLSAAVLSYCQVNNLAASLYIAFLESMFIDLDSFNVYMPLLQTTHLSNVVEPDQDADSILKKILYERQLKDSLYI